MQTVGRNSADATERSSFSRPYGRRALRAWLAAAALCAFLLCAPAGAAGSPASRPAAEDLPIRRTTGAGQRGGADSGFGLWRVAAALAAVIGCIFALRWVSQRAMGFGDAGASDAVRILARTAVSPRQQMLLVHVGRRVLLVGNSGGTLTTLAQITDPDEVAAVVGQVRQRHQAAPGAFARVFRRAATEYDQAGETVAETDAAPPAAARDGAGTPAARAGAEIAGLLAKVRALGGLFRGA